MIITIDNREKARICQAIDYYSPNYKIVIDELTVGDFLFSENKKEAIFEYKTLSDLMWSIADGRLFKQAVKQTEYYNYHHVLVEWDEKGGNYAKKQLTKIGKTMNNSIVYESLARLSTFTSVIISPKQSASFPLMEKYAQICFEENTFEKPVVDKTENVAFNYLMLIDGVDKIKARAICKKLKLKSINDLFKINTKKLVKVNGIGVITAQKIITSIVGDK